MRSIVILTERFFTIVQNDIELLVVSFLGQIRRVGQVRQVGLFDAQPRKVLRS